MALSIHRGDQLTVFETPPCDCVIAALCNTTSGNVCCSQSLPEGVCRDNADTINQKDVCCPDSEPPWLHVLYDCGSQEHLHASHQLAPVIDGHTPLPGLQTAGPARSAAAIQPVSCDRV